MRECTCHPDDNPPRPCPQKFALSACRLAAADIAPAEDRLTNPQGNAVWKSVSDLFDKHKGAQVDEMFLRGYNAALGDAMNALRPLWGGSSTGVEDNDLRK